MGAVRVKRGTGVHWVDAYVGLRVHNLRKANKMTQTKLGEELGISFQQIQKYESGANRMAVSMLWEIARVLHVAPTELLPRGRNAREAAQENYLVT